MALIIARVCRPDSKLATTRWWQDTTLAVDLGVAEASTDQVHAAMDWLGDRQDKVQRGLARRHLEPGGLVYYDLSSSWVEGRCCPLAARGDSRDGKRGLAQIEYGLLTDPQGRPVAVEVLAGNTGDPATVGATVAKVRDRFGIRRIVMVGDRGMLTSARVQALRGLGGVGWITTLRAPQVAALAQAGVIQPSLFDQTNLAEVAHPDYPGERLVVCRNPLLGAERARKRAELLDATSAELDKVVAAVQAGRLAALDRGQDRPGVGPLQDGQALHPRHRRPSLRRRPRPAGDRRRGGPGRHLCGPHQHGGQRVRAPPGSWRPTSAWPASSATSAA
jgi:hypothetical protein